MILGQRYQLEFRLVSTSTLTAGYKEHLLQLLVLSNSAVIESYLSILLNQVSDCLSVSLTKIRKPG